ncbi:MAG: fused MFS/spermidine synthase [Acidobacteriaceae bacterium]|nr:fused MFS/spermidine synthase [Acidobacteriaceae bacterium]
MSIRAQRLIVFGLFVGSGAASLIYEIVWQQRLQLIIGSSTTSLAVLLAIFMGGMCLGSLWAPRLVPETTHPLKVYAAFELAIGACGLLLLAVMPLVSTVYRAIGGVGPAGVVIRALLAALCLLPPTMLMGATLPIVSRWVERSPIGSSHLGLLYTGNLVGAVLGTLGAGFYLLRLFDMDVTTYVAVAANAAVAAVAWGIARRDELGSDVVIDAAIRAPMHADAQPARLRRVMLASALSGLCSLAAEVIWTRSLSLIFSATVYSFAIILAVFLAGLGLGSAAGSALARRTHRPDVWLGWCQLASLAAMAWSAVMLWASLPFWPVNTTLASSIWFNFQLDLVRAAWAILPGPILWGASFPLALASVTRASGDPARAVGRLYAANTIGAILGALATSFLLIPRMGSQHAVQLLMAIAALSALVMLWPASASRIQRAATAAVVIAALVLTGSVPALPPVLVAYGRHAAAWSGHTGEMLFVGEGMHASVAVSRLENGVLNYHNAGKIQASSQPPDMRLQRMLGHLTTIIPRHARKVLVIGCGAGVTAGAVSVSPMVDEVTIVDIEPLVPMVAREYFGSVNHEVLKNPKVHVVADDARHYLMTTKETFDAITSDPLDPWVKGAATLYTQEFFNIARERLNPGGVMTLFVQLYESSPEAVKSEVATFFSAFPSGLIFGNTFDGKAIDTVLVGQMEEQELYLDEIDAALRTPAFAAVAQSLGEINFVGTTDLFGNYAGRAKDLTPWMADAEINHDRDLRLQYLAGTGVNVHDGDAIYASLLEYRTFPEDLFVASDSTLWRLKQAIEGARE